MSWDCTSLALALGADPASFDLSAHTRLRPDAIAAAAEDSTRKTA
jgi:hypothetical protein